MFPEGEINAKTNSNLDNTQSWMVLFSRHISLEGILNILMYLLNNPFN